MTKINATLQALEQASVLLLQANHLHLQLCELELKREDEGKDFCWRLSDLIQHAYARCNRRYTRTLQYVNNGIALNATRACAASCAKE